ncbi:hypothetical protein [Methylobacterium pseudosasicola]|uniref:Uncharacterized protein n=1 Tax=Methylobacterium pseudosasicola TaxID=582667 RepID=A0A1I4RLF1_9HYPH|nr:hypothetical protein [Methylobacterium pseudosasicola]SFM52790.1 hypothetical protein SAMN05192568_103632 [Methylobacterium pseudosasicola]
MLNWMRSALVPKRRTASTDTTLDAVAAAQAFFNAQIARMPTVWPLEPANDDPMVGVAEVVERDLRTAGYLH